MIYLSSDSPLMYWDLTNFDALGALALLRSHSVDRSYWVTLRNSRKR
jgi:hypothetical protein